MEAVREGERERRRTHCEGDLNKILMSSVAPPVVLRKGGADRGVEGTGYSTLCACFDFKIYLPTRSRGQED